MEIDGLDERLKQAYQVETIADVARKMEVHYQTLDHWLQGRRKFPLAEIVRISNSTKRSIDWLLTGEEEAEPFGYLGDAERGIIEKVAKIEGQEFENVVGDLVREALVSRGSELFSNLSRLKPKERLELIALFELIREEKASQLASPRPAVVKR